MFRYLFFGSLVTLVSLTGFSQTDTTHISGNNESHTPIGHLNRIGFCSGLTFVPTHISNSKGQYIIVPTYGIEYERALKKWFAIGIVNELELENYIIERKDEESIERKYIYVASVIAIFQPIKHLILFAGPGYEFTSEHNFEVLKVGMAYSFHLSEEWELVPQVFFDRVAGLYTTYSFGLSIGRKF